ncbi:transposase [Streptomyces flaveolus]
MWIQDHRQPPPCHPEPTAAESRPPPHHRTENGAHSSVRGGARPLVRRHRRHPDEPKSVRKVVYSTNLIESINARLRKTTRNRGHFPSEQATLKVLYLAVRELINPKARDVNHVAAHWKTALNQFSLFFEDRLNAM